MRRKERIAYYKKIEKDLLGKVDSSPCLFLTTSDFKKDQLSHSAYTTLKDSLKTFDMKQKQTISVPAAYKDITSEGIKSYARNELISINREIKQASWSSVILLLIGSMFLILSMVVPFLEMFKEIIIITSWVFIWAAVENFFFKRTSLKANRVIILRLASLEIRESDN